MRGYATEYQSVKGIFIKSNGTKGSIFTIESGIPSYFEVIPDLAFGNGKFLVAYRKPYTVNNETHKAIYGKFVELNGTISPEFKISSMWGKLSDLNSIAFDGNNFLVVYIEDKYDTKVLARFVSPTLGPTGSELTIDDNNLPSDNPFSVFFDGEKYLVVWTDQTQDFPNVWQFYGRFVYPNGTMTSKFTITDIKSWKVAPSIAFDGTKYLITWNDGRNCGFDPINESVSCIKSGMDIYGRYFSKNGIALGREFVVSNLPNNEAGGILGRTNAGKALGIINKGVQLIFDQGPMSEDVDGKFWISSGYDIFAPDNQEKLFAGGNYTIRWRAPSQAVKFDLSYSTDNGQTWQPIQNNVASRTYLWNVPSQNGRKPNCKIRITAKDASNNNILQPFIAVLFLLKLLLLFNLMEEKSYMLEEITLLNGEPMD